MKTYFRVFVPSNKMRIKKASDGQKVLLGAIEGQSGQSTVQNADCLFYRSLSVLGVTGDFVSLLCIISRSSRLPQHYMLSTPRKKEEQDNTGLCGCLVWVYGSK